MWFDNMQNKAVDVNYLEMSVDVRYMIGANDMWRMVWLEENDT